MSTEQDKIRALADRIAQRLAAGGGAQGERRGVAESDELTQLRAALGELQQRLAHVESHVAHGEDCGRHGSSAGARDATRPTGGPQQLSPSQRPQRAGQQFLSSTYVPAVHPSQERFGIDEAVSELVDFFEREKVCSVEPGGKPCDQCGMCSARGF